jgi:hypothetical protein
LKNPVARRSPAVRCTTLFVALILGACAAPKPPSAFEEAYDDETRPWVEVETQLPSPPAASDLLNVSVGGGTSYRFQIDKQSMSIGSDGVFRYTLVATSAAGSRNVSYEGIRCDTHQRKIYAIGRADGTWVKARNAGWAPIEDVGNNRQHAALEKEYFCPEGYAARDIGTIIGRMTPGAASSEAIFDRQTKGIER